MKDLKEIEEKMKLIENNKLYSVKEVSEMGIITDTQNRPSIFVLLRLIRGGKIKAVNVSSGKKPIYNIKGSEIVKFISNTYFIEKVTK